MVAEKFKEIFKQEEKEMSIEQISALYTKALKIRDLFMPNRSSVDCKEDTIFNKKVMDKCRNTEGNLCILRCNIGCPMMCNDADGFICDYYGEWIAPCDKKGNWFGATTVHGTTTLDLSEVFKK